MIVSRMPMRNPAIWRAGCRRENIRNTVEEECLNRLAAFVLNETRLRQAFDCGMELRGAHPDFLCDHCKKFPGQFIQISYGRAFGDLCGQIPMRGGRACAHRPSGSLGSLPCRESRDGIGSGKRPGSPRRRPRQRGRPQGFRQRARSPGSLQRGLQECEAARSRLGVETASRGRTRSGLLPCSGLFGKPYSPSAVPRPHPAETPHGATSRTTLQA